MSEMARAIVFLSHSGVDTDAARELKRCLEESVSGREAGLRVWLDVEGGLVPGAVGWQAQIEEAIDKTCTAFAVHVGSRGIVNWVENEVRLALSRATRDKIPFIPILAKETPSAALPPFARLYQAVRDPLNDAGELAKLIAAVLQTGKPPIVVDEPFVGLQAMTEDDALLFFGRDKELEELEGKLDRSRLVAVVADSGSGKSSLVRAGLIRRYRGGVFADRRSREPDGRIWHVVVMRPGASPIDGLRMAVTTAAEQRGLSVEDKNVLRKALDFDDPQQTAFALQCNLPAATTETLLVVDQFEELFTQTPQPQRQPFIDWLLSLAAPGGQPSFRIVLTMRSDHFNLCSAHEALFALVSRDDAVLRLKSVTPEGLADIVREPLRLAGRTDQGEQEALIRQIRQQASERAGDLALVQMALYEAWTRRRQHNDDLVESFVAVGGVAGALANAAEEVLTKRLDETEQQLLEAVLVRLVVLGEAAGATRRTARLEEFGVPGSPKRLLIDKLADDKHGRLLLTGLETVEICHEQLVTQWPWWHRWINAHALDMRRLARLIAKACDWFEAPPNERASFLATGADLQIFSTLTAAHPAWLSEKERIFVADSQTQQQERIRQQEEAREREQRLRKEAEDYLCKAVENETRALTALSSVALTQGNANDAAKLAIAAWPRSSHDTLRPQLEGTLQALSFALSGSLYRCQLQHNGKVNGAVLTNDETRILSWSEDTTLQLWDFTTGTQIGSAMRHDDAVYGALLTRDNGRALSWSKDKTLRLWDLGTGQLFGPAMRHDGIITGALLTRDETRALSWSWDDTLRLWDLATGAQIGPPMRHDGAVYGALLTTGEAYALSWSEDNNLRLWDVGSATQVGPPMRHDGAVYGALLTTGEAYALSWSEDNTLRLWDVASANQIGPHMRHDGVVYGAALTTGEAHALSWSNDHTLRLWDLVSGTQIGLAMRHEAPVYGALLMKGKARALSWSGDHTLRLWDLVSGTQIGPAMRHEGAVYGALLTKDQARALSWSNDNTLRLWDLASGRQSGPAMRHDNFVSAALLTKNETCILSWSTDNSLRMWDELARGRQIGPAIQHDGEVTGALLTKDESHALSWSTDNGLRLWDLASGTQIGPDMQHDDRINGALLTKFESQAVSWSQDNTLRLWDLLSAKQIGPAMRHDEPVNGALLTKDEKHALSWSQDHTLRLWNLANAGQIGPAMRHDGPVWGAWLMSEGIRALSWSQDNTLRLWDLANAGQVGSAMRHDGSVWGARLMSEGIRAVSWSEDNTLRLWDLGSGQQIGPTMQHGGLVYGALLTKDETRALSWSWDNTLRLWDLASGAQVGPAMRHDGVINGVLLTTDEAHALSWSEDNTLRLWDLGSSAQIGPAMRHDDRVVGALLTKDERRVMSWSWDDTLRLWDLASRKPIGPAMRHEGLIYGALLMRDEKRAMSWSGDNTLRRWNLDWPEASSFVELACNLLRTDDLASFAPRYGIELQDPICREGVLVPAPVWKRTGPAN
ncbi:TIR domain-containing protein [Rhizobium leguminosarum]|uniref:nSTAND1 domain-containing NTPase n=1 Tax=Rhizobium leguminosarum TaxID=384 RepID=UPI001C96C2A8|nr:TIR domain-containing protein [Rhizobium leguminosarum]MBY5318650.1 TIR domain-containing protein [Rhizobium leguminosarum]